MADRSDWAVRLIDQVTAPAKKMKGAIGALEEQFKRAGRGVRSKAADAFVEGIGKVKESMIIAGVVAAGVGAAIIGATVKTADFAQTSLLGFKAVAKHGASAEKLFAHIRGEAERLGLDVMQSSKAFQGFIAQGADPLMSTNLVRMAADMKAFGAEGQQVESVLFNVKKILAQGKAQGDELAPIFEVLNAQKVFEKIADGAGKTVDEIIAMKEAGKLTSDLILPALIATSTEMSGGKQAGDAAAKLADTTLSGIAGKLKARAQNLFIDIGREATPAFMSTLDALQAEISGVLGDKSVKEGIVTAIETVAGLVRDAIPFIRQFVASFSDGFGEAWPVIKEVLATLFDGFGSGATWMDTVRDFASTLGKIVAFGVGVAVVFGGMVAAGIELVSHSVEGLIFLWNGMIGGIGAAAFAVDNFFSNVAAKWRAFSFADLARSMIDGLVNGITGGVGRVVDAVTNLGRSAKQAFESVLKIGSPSKVFEAMGEFSGEGYAIGLENSLDTVGPKFDGMAGMSAPDLGGDAMGGGRRGPLVLIENLNVYVGEQGGYEAGRQAAHGLEDELGSIFERWSLEKAA